MVVDKFVCQLPLADVAGTWRFVVHIYKKNIFGVAHASTGYGSACPFISFSTLYTVRQSDVNSLYTPYSAAYCHVRLYSCSYRVWCKVRRPCDDGASERCGYSAHDIS